MMYGDAKSRTVQSASEEVCAGSDVYMQMQCDFAGGPCRGVQVARVRGEKCLRRGGVKASAQ